MEKLKAKLELNGKVYTLQHPGNRAWVKLQCELIDTKTQRVDLERLLDYSFEHVIHPEEGPKLTIDTVPLKELEEWTGILPEFFRGDLAAAHSWNGEKPKGVPGGTTEAKE